jgi:hypothetical protein
MDSPMLSHSLRRGAVVLFATLALACSKDDDPVGPSSSVRSAPSLISGRVLGPDGTNICNTVGSGTLFLRLLNPDFTVGGGKGFLAAQDITCPDNRYSLSAGTGTTYLRVQLPTGQIGALPWRNLDQFAAGRTGAAHDIEVAQGIPLAGVATLEGAPFEGAGLILNYEFNTGFGAAIGVSDANGHWMDHFGRPPFLLQPGIRYQTSCQPVPGTRVIAGAPSSGFLFPDEVGTIDCTMESSPSIGFSHTATRLVVTPMPGDIGGSQSPEFLDQYGAGWGIQFPVETGSTPVHEQSASHLFVGGLLIGYDPDTILSGVNLNGEMQCGSSCRGLGLDGTVQFASTATGSQVTWRYSALNAPLDITQTSHDGRRPHDYVLFQFTIRNTSRFTRTFHAGFFGDWDVDTDAGDDVGFTEMDGKLMYVGSQDGTGNYAGTLLLGAPASGNFFFDVGRFPSTFDQMHALNGELREESAGPADLRYIHGAGPITLKRGQQHDLWIAVVAGEDRRQLLANAAAAEAEVTGK